MRTASLTLATSLVSILQAATCLSDNIDKGRILDGRSFLAEFRQMTLSRKTVTIQKENVELFLDVVRHEHARAEGVLIRLRAVVNTNDVVLWQAFADSAELIPYEFAFTWDKKTEMAGLCFLTGRWNGTIVFYEIDTVRVLQRLAMSPRIAELAPWVTGHQADELPVGIKKEEVILRSILSLSPETSCFAKDMSVQAAKGNWNLGLTLKTWRGSQENRSRVSLCMPVRVLGSRLVLSTDQ